MILCFVFSGVSDEYKAQRNMYSWHNNIYLKYNFFCNIVIFGQFNVSLLYKDISLKKIKKFILGGRGRV